MGILKDGTEINYNILDEKWLIPEVYEVKAEKPGYCIFNNTSKALKMLHKHIQNDSKIVMHTDVDVDGIGTTYILKRALESLKSINHLQMINKDKVHGIQQKHADYFKHFPVDLIIITDSSCNEIDTIKQFNCDALCIDHHELLHNDLSGKCNDGVHDYVIVNNTIENTNQQEDEEWLSKNSKLAFENIEHYTGTTAMSCGLVVYELLRVYCRAYSDERMLENLMLYQWAGVTLFTDVIDTLNKRNQWYMDNTVFSMDTERALGIMMKQINSFKATLDKSYIQYSFAPIINKAIRAGDSNKILDRVINNPSNIKENLEEYERLQTEAIEKATTVETKDTLTGAVKKVPIAFNTDNIMLDISSLGINANYTGVIASKLQGNNKANAAVYNKLDDNSVKGSFRGRYKNVDYRKFFEESGEGIYAQGHSSAFGFKLEKAELENIANGLQSIEPKGEDRPWLTAGNMTEDERGKYHITDIEEFKRQGYIWMIATGNSKVPSTDEIVIRVKSSDVTLKETRGKLYVYNALGLECKAFKPLEGKYFDVYMEHSNEVCFYIK